MLRYVFACNFVGSWESPTCDGIDQLKLVEHIKCIFFLMLHDCIFIPILVTLLNSLLVNMLQVCQIKIVTYDVFKSIFNGI